VFNRRHVEDVYVHLGAAESLVVEHEAASAVHLSPDDSRGVVIELQDGASLGAGVPRDPSRTAGSVSSGPDRVRRGGRRPSPSPSARSPRGPPRE
jgi:hypothetical protein